MPIRGDDGTYTVTVGKSSGETVSFDVAKQSTVLSMEYTQAKYILEYATKMMLVTGYDLITAYTTQSVSNDVVCTNFDIQCGPKPQNVSIFSAKYTGDALSECDSEKLTLTPGETAQITLTNTYSPDTTIKYNIFVWDDNLKPYKAVWK
ncbi:MAG: hypothetical protein J6D26_07500 [Clostridia bacterium]|nr:hypothetical protein [Clostridia bacterium]